MEIILASNNQNKIKEIKQMFKNKIEVKSLKEEGIDIDVVEDGSTFIENSQKKALEIYNLLKQKNKKDFMVISDDSGLSVDYLNGEPGVYSARYAGEEKDFNKNIDKLLNNLKDIPMNQRTASFICVMTLINLQGNMISVEGKIDGYITKEERGKEGFAYDSIFYVKDKNKTFAQMNDEEKNSISHRRKALEKIKIEIDKEMRY